MRQLFFALALFVSSACGLIIEIVAGRLLAPYVGMSLYSWTAIIAVVLAGLSAGHWVGGFLAAPHVDARLGARRVAWALALAALSALLSLVLLRTVSGTLMTSGMGLIPVIVLLSIALFFLPSFFVGIVSPILTKIAVEESRHHAGRVIGRMYALGTMGSIAGTLGAGYFFISWIGSTGTVILVAATYGLLALLFAIADPLRLLVVALLVAGGGGTVMWGNSVNAFTSPCKIESDYFCIRIDDNADAPGQQSRIMALDHLVHSVNDRFDPGYLFSPYIHFVDEYTKARLGSLAPEAFFIGGGGFTLPRAWSYDYEGVALIVAEIDPAVTAAARNYLWLDTAAPGLDIRHADARQLLQALAPVPRFDVIFGDAFHDISIPPHLVSREFHGEIARRLNAGGFYAVNVVDRGANPRFLKSLVKTLKEDFAAVEVWVEREQIGQSGRVTFVVIASNRALTAGHLQARRGVARTWIRWPQADLEARLTDPDLPILTDDFAPVDRLMAGLLLGEGP